MLQVFNQFFKEHHLLQPHYHFIVACSGGVDSVVLCELCKQSGIKFSIAHCNFSLRGEESERDESFVRGLGEKYGVEVFVKKFDTTLFAEEKKISIQEAARDLRYTWFEALRKEKEATFTLLAHHANDNVETVLMNFFRGTGLEGLTGMDAIVLEKHCLRPLLNIKRIEIETFSKENDLSWVEDSSNASNKYTRNFFRNELLPQIQKVYPQAEENLLNNIDRFKKTNALFATLVNELKQKLCKKKGEEIRIPVKKLMAYSDTSLIYEVIKDFGFGEKQVAEVIKLAQSESGKFIENESYQIIKHRNWFIIAPKTSAVETVSIDEGVKEVRFKAGIIEVKEINSDKIKIASSQNIAQLDAKGIVYPLLLRKWKEGDYFYPLGMRKKKKVARFFIDQKMSKWDKENTWVLESCKRIIWIVNHRIDDRFKITESTKKVLQISTSSP